jgi:hypothetical protein
MLEYIPLAFLFISFHLLWLDASCLLLPLLSASALSLSLSLFVRNEIQGRTKRFVLEEIKGSKKTDS